MISVIIPTYNGCEMLRKSFPTWFEQTLPQKEYEVIVVDDGSEDDTRQVVESYMVQDPRLHMTFVPYGARVGSTKKLALTLAAKAAKYDYLLLLMRIAYRRVING